MNRYDIVKTTKISQLYLFAITNNKVFLSWILWRYDWKYIAENRYTTKLANDFKTFQSKTYLANAKI